MIRTTLRAGAAALAIFPLLTAAASAQEAGAIFDSLDRIHPVWAQSGMVSAQEHLAAAIGRDIMEQGGNAVDAGVAVAFALAVTLPRAGNIGGGGFMLIHDAETGQTHAIDYREMAPSGASRDMFLGEDGEPDSDKSLYSGASSGVPGTVAGMRLALEKYGTMEWADVIAPAIRLAEEGMIVTPDLADSLEAAREHGDFLQAGRIGVSPRRNAGAGRSGEDAEKDRGRGAGRVLQGRGGAGDCQRGAGRWRAYHARGHGRLQGRRTRSRARQLSRL